MDKSTVLQLDRVDYDSGVDIYRQAARELAAKSDGLERYVINIFGADNIGSLACAIDPYRRFRNTPVRTALLSGNTPPRVREKVTSQGVARYDHTRWTTVLESYIPDPSGELFRYLETGPFTSDILSLDLYRTPQGVIKGFIRDFVRSIREEGVDQGEMELFLPQWRSPSRSYKYKLSENDVVYNIGGDRQHVNNKQYILGRIEGPDVLCDPNSITPMYAQCATRALSAMTREGLGLIDRCLPTHRTSNIFYQIAELKDLPQTLRGTLQIWRGFERTVGSSTFRALQQSARSWRDPHLLRSYERQLGSQTRFRFDPDNLARSAGDAFLTFKFGWQSMIAGISQMLPSPARASIQVNYLIDRIGQDTTFRANRNWIEKVDSFPDLSYSLRFFEENTPFTGGMKISGRRHCQLRCVTNSAINFPHLDVPNFRSELYERKLGLWPTPSDIFDLIPWTWLIDWFGGLGQYVHLMDGLANDHSLVNFGFLTYRETSVITGTAKCRFAKSEIASYDGVINGPNYSYSPTIHQGRLILKYQLRLALSSVASIKSYWDSDLNASQSAVIGALLAQRRR